MLAAVAAAVLSSGSAATAARVAPAKSDAHVTAARPTVNYGGVRTLVVDARPTTRAYVRFDVRRLRPLGFALTLRVYVRGGAGARLVVRRTSASWSEARITYRNAPALGSTVASKRLVRGWNSIAVPNALVSRNTIGLALTTARRAAISVASSEAPGRAPRLITVDEGPPSPPAPGTAKLIAAGDIASCSSAGDEATAALLDGLSGTIAALGDTVYESGTRAEYLACYTPSWGRHLERTRPAVGNHEYATGNAGAYFDYFQSRAGPRGLGYYSYDLGQWHIVVLNTSDANCLFVPCGVSSAQAVWLRNDLANNPRACTLAYWHHPMFSSNTFKTASAIRPFWDALHAARADVVLVGHAHHYERFAPQDPSGVRNDAAGIRQFIVGTGGRSLRPVNTVAANSEVRDSSTFGLLELTLRPTDYSWRFVPVRGGKLHDAGRASCH